MRMKLPRRVKKRGEKNVFTSKTIIAGEENIK